MTDFIFRNDSYATETQATVIEIDPENGLVLDRTIFYVQGGGQSGDIGMIVQDDGFRVRVVNTIYSADRSKVFHKIETPERFSVGEKISLQLDWETRFARMKIHTALHLLSVILPHPVTGGAIGDGTGRLDFDIADANLDKDELTEKLNELIKRNASVSERFISEEELDANPGLVKTMSVQPPRGTGQIRLVEIEGLDLQPCGGTHVRATGEIGQVAITGIEKKGRMNRRVRIALI